MTHTHVPGDSIEKDPSSIEPQGFDWTAYLNELTIGSPSIQIVASTWAVYGPDNALTLTNKIIVSGGQKTQCVLNGGTLGGVYTITNHITTNSTPTDQDERSFEVVVTNR